LLGRVSASRAIDLHGFEATLTVERALVGSEVPGAVVHVAWEELARGASDRLHDGTRVLLALDPLPTQSLWQNRFPAGGVRVISGQGAGVIRAPDESTVAALDRFLTLSPEARTDKAGVAALVELLVVAPPSLALAAVECLAELPELELHVSASVASALSEVAASPERPLAVREAVFELAAQQQLMALRPAVEAAARSGPPLEVAGWQALAALDGRVQPADLVALLESEQPALRVLGVRHARDTPSEPRVAAAINGDPAPEVRAAAVHAWCAWHGTAGAKVAEPALFDPEPAVRGAAAESLGGLGEALVPRLEELANEHEGGAAAGPLWALSHAGAAGRLALRRIAVGHPDDRVRKLAAVISGKPLLDH